MLIAVRAQMYEYYMRVKYLNVIGKQYIVIPLRSIQVITLFHIQFS